MRGPNVSSKAALRMGDKMTVPVPYSYLVVNAVLGFILPYNLAEYR